MKEVGRIAMESFDLILEKVYQWVGQRLSSCPVRDGVTFYKGREKLFKVVRRKHEWHLEFSIAVPNCPGLKVLTVEEARAKKLGKSRWIYRGNSETDAKTLIETVLATLSQHRYVEPAMAREVVQISHSTCPCFRKMENMQHTQSLPEEISNKLREAYQLLQESKYNEFIYLIQYVLDDVTSHLLAEKGLTAEGSLMDKINRLAEHKIVSKTLKDELESVFIRKVFERTYSDQERAYPTALMLVSFTSKLLKNCS